jgi:hypothetical protein
VRKRAHLTIDSYADPAISALTDPLLARHPDHCVALGMRLFAGPSGRQMRSHYLTIAGYQLVLAASVSLRVLAVRISPRLPPLGQVFTHVMRTRTAASAASWRAPGSGCNFFGQTTALRAPRRWRPRRRRCAWPFSTSLLAIAGMPTDAYLLCAPCGSTLVSPAAALAFRVRPHQRTTDGMYLRIFSRPRAL